MRDNDRGVRFSEEVSKDRTKASVRKAARELYADVAFSQLQSNRFHRSVLLVRLSRD